MCYGPGGSDSVATPSPVSSPSSTTPASPAATSNIKGKQVAQLLVVLHCILLISSCSDQAVVQWPSLLPCRRLPWQLSRHSNRVTSRQPCSQKQRVPQHVLLATCMMVVCCWTPQSPFQAQTAMLPAMLLASRVFWRLKAPLSSLLPPTEQSQWGVSLQQVSSKVFCM